MQVTQVQTLVWEDPLRKGIATRSNILVWRMLGVDRGNGELAIRGVAESDMTERLTLQLQKQKDMLYDCVFT